MQNKLRDALKSVRDLVAAFFAKAKGWLLANSLRGVLLGVIAGALMATGVLLSISGTGSSNSTDTAGQPSQSQEVEIETANQDPDIRTMPPLLGKRVGEFEDILLGLGVNQWSTVEVESDQPAGVIVDTNPGPGEEFSLSNVNGADLNNPNGGGVLLQISKGKNEAQADPEPSVDEDFQSVQESQQPGTGGTGEVTMPNLIGLTKQQASNALRDIGILTFGYGEVPSRKPAGTIVAQSHPQGTVLDIALSNRPYNPNQENPNHIFFEISTGFDEPASSTLLTNNSATISWDKTPSQANWGFTAPTVQNGVLTIMVDAKFPRDAEIQLDPAIAYATVNDSGRVGFMNGLPKSVGAGAGDWIVPIKFQVKISNLGINEPKTATIRLRVKDAKGTHLETLRFSFGPWR